MRYRKSEASIAQILSAAVRVLARQGYARTSLMDIAREAGMSKGAVHYHFPSKDDLMGAVLTYACDAVRERTVAAWGGERPDALEALRASVRELWAARTRMSDEARVVADLLAQSLHDEKLRPKLADYYRLAAAQVEEHLREQAEKLGLQPRISPALLARIVIGLLDGLAMQQIVDGRALSEDEVLEAVELMALGLFDFAPQQKPAPDGETPSQPDPPEGGDTEP